MPSQNIPFLHPGKQISPTPKKLIRFPTLQSILDFPSAGKSKPESGSPYPPNQKFTCPNCDELTDGFPCEFCGYEEMEFDYDPTSD